MQARPKVFLYSDSHFSHKGVTEFLDHQGNKLRPWDNVEDMDRDMIALFNATVSPQDKTYFLGDVAMSHKALPILNLLNGKKVLIKGNHDIHDLKHYTPYFKDIRAYHVLNGMLLSHIPVHPDSVARFGTNVHGHLHSNQVVLNGVPDPRYYCVCVEQTGFKPIQLEQVQENIIKRGGVVGHRPKGETLS